MIAGLAALVGGFVVLYNMRSKMIKVKQDVRVNKFQPQTVYAIGIANSIYQRYGLAMMITSGSEEYAARASPNYHETGYAFDLRLPSRSEGFEDHTYLTDADVRNEISATLGYEFDVVLEKDHIHIEFDYNRANNTNTYGA